MDDPWAQLRSRQSLEGVLARHHDGGRTLILCRSSAQVDSLRRIVARRGALAGVELATPWGLALSHYRPPPGPVEEEEGPEQPEAPGLPPELSLAQLVGPRPGLVDHLRRWANALRLHRAAEPGGVGDLDEFPAELVEIANSDWGADEGLAAVQALLAALASPQQERPPGLAWDRVLALGFGDWREPMVAWEREFLEHWTEPGLIPERGMMPTATWEHRLLELLEAIPIFGARPGRPSSIPSVLVADAAAEARCVALLLSRRASDGVDSSRALVLVPSDEAAERIRTACSRSGVTTAGGGERTLRQHPLAGAVETAAGWFRGSSAVRLRGADLCVVLTHPMLGRGWVRHVASRANRLLSDAGVDLATGDLRWSRRAIERTFHACRLVVGSVAQWRSTLEAVVRSPEHPHIYASTRAAAAILWAGLPRLEACVRGEAFAEAEGLPERGPLPAAGTVGALRRFLLDLGVRVHDDPVARALFDVLAESRSQALTLAELGAILARRCSERSVAFGVDILAYADYDGRPCELLVLAGVHSEGVGKAPAPDPFASERQQLALGRLGPATRVRYVLLQAQRAAARSDSVMAIVSRRDGSGRPVTAPIELSLDFARGTELFAEFGLEAAGLENDSFGLQQPLPCRRQRELLRVVTAEQPGEPPTQPGLRRAFVQANAEWYRAGRGAGQRVRASDLAGDGDLAHLLRLRGRRIPEWAAPYLGELENEGEARLPTGLRWSVSSGFAPLCHCPYQLFAGKVLELREPDELPEEVDAAARGTAVHRALELVGDDIAWHVVDPERQELERSHAVERVCVGLEHGFGEELDRWAHPSPGLKAAIAGIERRWKAFAPALVAGRVGHRPLPSPVSPEALSTQLVKAHGSELVSIAAEAREQLLQAFADWRIAKRESRLELWLAWALLLSARGEDLRKWDEQAQLRNLGGSNIQVTKARSGRLTGFVASATFEEAAARVKARVDQLTNVVREALQARYRLALFHASEVSHTAVELFFDHRANPEANLEHAHLHLGERELPVGGVIDRVQVAQVGGESLIHIVDYKARSHVPSAKAWARDQASIKDPQLLVYALVLEDALAREGAGLAGVEGRPVLVGVGEDYVTRAEGVRERALPPSVLKRGREVLTQLVDGVEAGRFPLSPRPDTCGVLSGGNGDYCVMRRVCRIRGVPERELSGEELEP